MTIEYLLAQDSAEPWVGDAVRTALLAALFVSGGVALLALGVRRRLARARWKRDDDRRLSTDGSAPEDDHRAPTTLSGGIWPIFAGVVLVILGLGHVLHLVVTLHLAGIV